MRNISQLLLQKHPNVFELLFQNRQQAQTGRSIPSPLHTTQIRFCQIGAATVPSLSIDHSGFHHLPLPPGLDAGVDES